MIRGLVLTWCHQTGMFLFHSFEGLAGEPKLVVLQCFSVSILFSFGLHSPGFFYIRPVLWGKVVFPGRVYAETI